MGTESNSLLERWPEAHAGVAPAGDPFRIDLVVFANVRYTKEPERWYAPGVGVLRCRAG